jgi:hypothetical protein
MLSGFVPQENYFILGYKKAKKDLAKNTIREKAENDNLFREILNQEIRKYDEKTGKESKDLVEENKIFEEALSLNFMHSGSL